MAGCTYLQVLKFGVITQIFLLCVAQNTHRQNVAIGKTCGISSKYFSSDTCSAAINGNNRDLNYPGNCIHTAENDYSPFWWVDLGNEFTISTMTIYGRTYHTDRMTQVNIFLDKTLVKRFTSQDTWTNDKHVITVGRVGRVVNITKDNNKDETMNICEVEVWVCDDRWYGDCTQACTYCPGGSGCDKVDGSCTTCYTGFQLPHCEVCDNGWYGDNCTQVCGHCGGDSFCDKKTGSCTSCQTGFQLPLCRVCADGWYGDSCTQTCGHCADSSVCDKVNGSCTSCQTGFQPPLCQECADGWYGVNCTQTCGHCLDASVCNKMTGSCTSCKSGFQLPLCKECADGRYGGNCTQTCGSCAVGSFCDKVNGTCVSCKTGFNPPFCTECQDGWFGDNCAETCGHCVGGNSTCDKTDGSCPSCDGELQLPLCKESVTLEQTQSSGPPVGSIVGPVLAVVVAAVVAVIVVVWLRRLRKSRSQQPNEADSSPYEISMTSVADPSMPTSRPDKKADDTSDYSNIGDSINIYDALKAPDDDSKAVYTSLRCHANAH